MTTSPSDPPIIAVLGGSGFIGQALCAHLARQSLGTARTLRVITRSREKAKSLWSLPGVEILEADVQQEAALADALEGVSAVVNLVGVLQSRSGRPWGPEFDESHVRLASRLARCMTRQGVRRLIHISALGASDQAPSMYLRSKAAGEAALRGTLNLELTILRPSVVFGPGDQFLNLFAKMQAVLPLVPLASAPANFQPFYVGDLVRIITRCLQSAETRGKVYECVGPEVLSLYEIVHWAGFYSGHPRPIFPLPDGLAWLQALIMEHLPGRPLLSRDNLASASVPNIGQGPMSAELGITSPVSLHAIAPAMLGGQTPRGRLMARRAREH
jgi:NADH dehydrogenase